jgi:cytochrome d ubiquinol oxidase subunit II
MTVVAVMFTPLVLIYQGWTYWVFRRRVSVSTSPTGDEHGEARTPPPDPPPPAEAPPPARLAPRDAP